MIKFIYFDVGGVIIKDFSGNTKWTKMKKVMGVKKDFDKEFDSLYNQYEFKELNLTRPVDTLIPIFTKKFGMNFPKGFSMFKYFIDHFEQNRSLWPILKKIKKSYRVGLLTNMYVGMFDKIKKQGLLPPIDWDIIIESTEIGMRKPDKKIFEFAQKKSGVNNREILFVDNSKENIDAARELGWQTFLYDSSQVNNANKKLDCLFTNIILVKNQ